MDSYYTVDWHRVLAVKFANMRTEPMSRAGGAPLSALKTSKVGDGNPEALLYVLPYVGKRVGVRALLTLEAVSRELRNAIREDATLWQHMHVDGSLRKKLTVVKLRKLARRAEGRMRTLSLPNCTRVSECVVREIVAANPLLHELDLSGCEGVTARAVLAMVRMQAARHAPGLTKLRIQGLYGVSPEMLDAIQTTMQVTNAPHSPQYYSRGELSPRVSDDRPLDLEACPNCGSVATVFDCTRSTCKQLRSGALQQCRACYDCIARCEECGACITDFDGAEETFCGEFLCETCEYDLGEVGRCSECDKAGCSRHLEAMGVEDFTDFICDSCQDLLAGDNEIIF